MDMNLAIEEAMNGNAILFLGAGFSRGAKNLHGEPFLTGTSLANHLCKQSGLSDENASLDIAAELYQDAFGAHRLITELHQLFTAKFISVTHEEIAKLPWKRIYTTNYDNVLETAAIKLGQKIVPVTLADDPRTLSPSSRICLHINGYIDALTTHTLHNSFRLTTSSYLADSFSKSEWSFIFRSDVKIASAVFFVGYSLFDFDIKKILFQEHELLEKCFFIVDPRATEVERRMLTKYGSLQAIGAEEFANQLTRKCAEYTPQERTTIFGSFIELRIQSLEATPFRDDYVFELLLHGAYRSSLIFRAIHAKQEKYYFVKRAANDDLAAQIQEKGLDTIVCHSNLGNGKTLFIEGLCCKLLSETTRVFRLDQPRSSIEKEIDALCELKGRVIVVIENYQRFFDIVRLFQLRRPASLILIFSARTAIHELNHERLLETLRVSRISELDLNELSDSDVAAVVELLDTNGLWGEHSKFGHRAKLALIRDTYHRELQNLLLDLLRSPDIRKRYTLIVDELNRRPDLHRPLILAFALELVGYDASFHLISELLQSDVLSSAAFRTHPLVRELVSVQANRLLSRSSVLATQILTHLSDASIVIDTLILAATRADQLASFDRFYAQVLREMVMFANLIQMLPSGSAATGMVRFYEAMKNSDGCRSNPHFWLQYGIARLFLKDYEKAEIYLKSAYGFARKRLNHKTTQIDIYFARLLLERAIADPVAAEAMPAFTRARDLLNNILIDSPHRYSVYPVIELYGGFNRTFRASLAREDEEIFCQGCQFAIDHLKTLDSKTLTHAFVQSCFRALREIPGIRVPADANSGRRYRAAPR